MKSSNNKKEKFHPDLIYYPNGKIDYTVDSNINLEKGLFSGVGYSLTKPMGALVEPIFSEWSALNSHKLTLGTTRQGKTRAMVSDIEQQIALNENVIVEDPKGSIDQEMFGYIIEKAMKYNRLDDIRYVSPFFKDHSEYFNPLFRYKNEQIASMVADIINADDEFYANIAKAIVMSATIGLEFLEKYNDHHNKYDLLLMEKMEYAFSKARSTNKINKFIWEDEYSVKSHGIRVDIFASFKKGVTDERELAKINEAIDRTKLRYANSPFADVVPLRKFITLRDLAQFESIDVLTELKDEVEKAYEVVQNDDAYAYLRKIGSEAIGELTKISGRDSGFFSKVVTTYSTSMSELITGDVGVLLNESRINRLADDLTSSARGIILFVQPYPMIYKAASDALGKILFYMINSLAGYIGASGKSLSRRTYVNIDEAGSVLTNVVRELANKGGGLGFSLFLYTQSIADIEDTLGPEGARILMDNMNTKAIFKGNDPASLKMISEMLGTRKKAAAMGTSTDQRNTRVSVSTSEESIAEAGVLSQLDQRKFILKHGSEIYLVAAPYVPDARIAVIMPIDELSSIARASDYKYNSILGDML